MIPSAYVKSLLVPLREPKAFLGHFEQLTAVAVLEGSSYLDPVTKGDRF